MILPLTLFMQITAACAPPQTWNLLRGIAAHESGFNPNAIHVNGRGGRSYYPATAAAAIEKARQLIAAGENIDGGLMGINIANWHRLGLTVETVFNPCQSVRAAADVLGMVSEYNTGSSTRGFRNGYVARVVASAQRAGPQITEHSGRLALARVVAPAPPTTPADWNVFPDDKVPQ